MKVYDETKTRILEQYDLEKGYLKEDTITNYFEEVQEVKEQGHFETIREYPNGGKDVEWVVEVEGVEYQPAREEIEDICVYVPYTSEELLENKKILLRERREPLLAAFDKYKSNINYGIESEDEAQRQKIIAWYKLLLELDEFAFNNIPERVQYYL